MAGDSAIFRFTTPGDTEASVGSTEKIEFNSGVVPDSTGRAVSTSFKMRRDINFQANPGTDLDRVQDSLLGTLFVTVAGYFVDHNNTQGPTNLFNWSKESSIVPGDFRFGRFGLRVPAFSGLLSLTPTVFTGYMLYEIDVQDVEEPRVEVPFVATFYRNGVI